MKTIYWHDYETTGVNPARDRPLQFAGVRTDENLEVVGEPLTLFCQPSREILPQPMAALITGITPQQALEKGHPEPEFIRQIYQEFSRPETCVAGYNNLRFDDEVTRYTLYRNFYDPYEREWKGGNSRWDIIDMLRLTHALRPDGIEWPRNEDGAVSFRLELLTAANNIAHEAAHDAMSDVWATIAMARLVRDKQPRLYEYVYQHRLKHSLTSLINLRERKPFFHVSSKLPRDNAYAGLMIPLCEHPSNKNAIIAFNLMADPEPLLNLDADAIRERLFTPGGKLPEEIERIPLKGIHLNRCPIVATPKLLDEKVARRLGIDLARCEQHLRKLQAADLSDKLRDVFSRQDFPEDSDADLALYRGFLPSSDKPLLAQVRSAGDKELASYSFVFEDPRYSELLFRYRARNAPASLSEEEQLRWDEYKQQIWTDSSLGYLTVDQYFEELDRLEAGTALSVREQRIIAELREWGDILVSS